MSTISSGGIKTAIMEFLTAFGADVVAYKIFGSHGNTENGGGDSPARTVGKKAAAVAQETILKPTAQIRSDLKALVLRLMTQADGAEAVKSLQQHQINRTERRVKSYGSEPRQRYGAAAETDMWRAFDALKGNLDDDTMVEVLKYMGHLSAEEFDAEIESLIDNALSQRCGQFLEVIRQIADKANEAMSGASGILGFVNNAIDDTALAKKGGASRVRLDTGTISPSIIPDDWIESQLRNLRSRRR